MSINLILTNGHVLVQYVEQDIPQENHLNINIQLLKKLSLTVPNLLPYLNGEGRYLHALKIRASTLE